MDEGEKHVKPNPMGKANFLSSIFFWYVGPIFRLGYKKRKKDEALGVDDMWNVMPEDTSQHLCKRLELAWQEELDGQKKGRQPSLRRAVIRVFRRRLLLTGIGAFIEESSKVVQPLLLGKLIQYFMVGSEVSTLEAYMYALGVSLCSMVVCLSHHPYFFSMVRSGMWMRIATCALMYRKSLKLSPVALGKTTTGQIVNLMSNDVIRFDMACNFIHHLWIGPLQLVVVSVILWLEIGPASLAGLSILVLLLPFQMFCGKLFAKFRRKVAEQTDERVKVMNEVLTGMRVIKMYCWEKPFMELVNRVRSKEVSRIRIACLTRATSTAPFFASAKVIAYLTFMTYIMTGNRLDASTVFVVIGLYNPVRLVMTLFLPWGMQLLSEVMVTIKRIQDFLLLEEIEDSVASVERSGEGVSPSQCKVVAMNMTGKWDQSVKRNTLDNVSFDVGPGELLAVVGPVGGGKSSLLLGLLGELPLTGGSVKVHGRVAYASQQPWVFSASVRQNIIFGAEFDEKRYKQAIKAAALTRDLEIMPEGERTLIGDRGASLSGGQKARIGLARALYHDADIYLLDDPLSAVDPEVSKHIFDQCICGVLKNKPRILVTHQLQYLQSATRILILQDGDVLDTGTYEELEKRGIDFTSLLKTEEDETSPALGSPILGSPANSYVNPKLLSEAMEQTLHISNLSKSVEHDSVLTTEPNYETAGLLSKSTEDMNNGHLEKRYKKKPIPKPVSALKSKSRDSLSRSQPSLHDSLPYLATSMVSLTSLSPDVQPDFVAPVQQEEHRALGSIGTGMYLKYIYSGAGVVGSILLILLNLGAQTAYVGADWWLSYWSNREEEREVALAEHLNISATLGHNNTNVTVPDIDQQKYIYIYSGITLLVFILGLLRAIAVYMTFVQAAKKLHNRMFSAIVRCPIKFFDNNPVGRVLNRFSKDTGILDELLPNVVLDCFQCSLLVLAVLVVTCAVNPWVLIPTAPICILFVFLRQYYLCTSRAIKRLEGTTRSPVFSHLSASLQGLQTIRAYRVENTFKQEFDTHQDQHSETWLLFLLTSRWLAIKLDWMCALFITIVAFTCVQARDSLSAGLVGLTLTTAFGLLGVFQWTIRQSIEAENQMTSAERLMEYADMPPEAPLESEPDLTPPSDWPQYGVITGENARLRYSPEGDYVLKDLRFCIRAKEKVGIVGRTGAGKSSLIAMLFRLTEPEGKIMIDGIDITTIGLHDLRKKIAIIPQDPVLFTGTVRKNLDPFHENSDTQLWKSLAEVQLKPKIEALQGGLEANITEGGCNFSVGERQLVCLARALLKNNRILIIDEATANVDPYTDSLIQGTIREKFIECTVLTIAHRLNTIMDSDRVMVLSEGRIVEYDPPHTLLQDPSSIFHSMVSQTGPQETEKLKAMAEGAHASNNTTEGEGAHTDNNTTEGEHTKEQNNK